MRMRLAILAAFPLHVIPGLEALQARGHYATWLPQLSEGLASAEELEIHWLVATREPVPAEQITWRGQTFHLLHVPGKLRLMRGYFGEIMAIRRRLRELRPDLVHAWGSEECYALAGAFSGWPWLLSMQGILQEYIRRAPMPPLRYLQASYEWLALRRAREVCTESPWADAVMQRYAPKARRHVVEYAVSPLFYETSWQPDPERRVTLFVGTEEPRKGLADALAAFQDARLAGMELHVLGVSASAGQRHLPPNIRFLGRKSLAEIAEAMSRAWCLVMPTLADTGPMVVKEARVVGLPVISSPNGGTSTYITPGVNGFLCACGDVAAVASALAKTMASLETARSLGAGRWEEQRAYFHPDRMAGNFRVLYARLGKERGAP